MYALLALLLSLGAVRAGSLTCFAGLRNYAASEISERHYWHCPVVAQPSVLRECTSDQLYDRKTGLCLAARVTTDGRLVKRSAASDKGEVEEREALGEVVNLGTLYDAKTSLMANGASLWNDDTINAHSDLRNTVYSNVNVYMENGINERTYTLGVDASLKLEFLGGLITVGGSAHYLRDESSKTDIARVTMNYQATTKTKTMPIKTPLTFNKFCANIDDHTGPTHVITSITYGMRSFFIFEREVHITEYKEEIGGSLEIAIQAVPSFSIGVEAAVDIHGNAAKNLDNVRIKFYGDAIIDKMPATYNQTVYVFEQVNRQAKESMTPIKYQLTPIGYFCDGINAIINDINADLVSKSTTIITELTSIQKTVDTLLGRDPSIRFTSIKSQLLTFSGGLKDFTNGMIADIAELVPALKAGDADESDLVSLIARYQNSIYQKTNADIFLDNRAREIRTIELVTERANSLQVVELSDIGAATDNKCIFSQKYATVYVLYVLPATNVAKSFIEGTTIDESDMWYNDLYRVGQAGAELNEFLTYAAINHNEDHCLLIRLDNITQSSGNDVEIRMYENGQLIEPDFKPPAAPPAPVCTLARYSGLELASTPLTEPTSHVTGTRVTVSWSTGTGNETVHHPTSSDHANAAALTVTGLKPYTEYTVKTSYLVRSSTGVSPVSTSVTCKTAPTTAPVLPAATAHTTSSIALKWAQPQKKAVDGAISYLITASVDGEAKRQVTTSATSTTVDNLEPGVYYKLAIQAVYDGETSEAVTVTFATIPFPPDVPLLEVKTASTMQLLVHLDRIVLPAGITKDALIVRYYKMNAEGSEVLYGTSKTKTEAVDQTSMKIVDIANLDAGVKYGVKCKLRLRAAGRLFETAESEAIIVTTDLPEGDFGDLEADITAYVGESSLRISSLVGRVNTINSDVDTFQGTLNTKISELDSEISQTQSQANDKFAMEDSLVSGVSRDSCIKRGVRYSGTQLQTYTGVKSEYDCVRKCRAVSSANSVQFQVAPSNEVGKCICLRERRGAHMDAHVFYVSVNIMCYDIMGAGAITYNSCVKVNTNLRGNTASVHSGVGSIKECARLCSDTDNCVAVTYNRNTGVCYLKSSGGAEEGANEQDSLSLSCLHYNWVTGAMSAARDDATSTATCPSDTAVSHCEVLTGGVGSSSDGAYVETDGRSCVAVASSSGSGVVAQAECAPNTEIRSPCYETEEPLPLFRVERSQSANPTAGCPAGYSPLLCNAHSPWPGNLVNKGVNSVGVVGDTDTCSVRSCSNYCKVTLVCKRNADLTDYATSVCTDIWVDGAISSTLDDATSTASCPTGYAVSYCEVKTGQAGTYSDGAYVDGSGGACIAVNAGRHGGSGVVAHAKCSPNTSITRSGKVLPLYMNLVAKGATPSLECPAGYSPVVCNAHTPWGAQLLNKGVDDVAVIPGSSPCRVEGCSESGYCRVTLVCKRN